MPGIGRPGTGNPGSTSSRVLEWDFSVSAIAAAAYTTKSLTVDGHPNLAVWLQQGALESAGTVTIQFAVDNTAGGVRWLSLVSSVILTPGAPQLLGPYYFPARFLRLSFTANALGPLTAQAIWTGQV